MGINDWLSGVSQKIAADQLKPYVDSFKQRVGGKRWPAMKGGFLLLLGAILGAGAISLSGMNMKWRGENSQALVTLCDIWIGEREHANLVKVLRQMQKQVQARRPGLEAHVVVDPGKEESCLYAKDLYRVFKDADWKTHIVNHRAELIGKGVWFYGLEHEAEAKKICDVLKEQIDPEVTCCGNRVGEPYLNTWDLYVRSASGGLIENEVECLPLD